MSDKLPTADRVIMNHCSFYTLNNEPYVNDPLRAIREAVEDHTRLHTEALREEISKLRYDLEHRQENVLERICIAVSDAELELDNKYRDSMVELEHAEEHNKTLMDATKYLREENNSLKETIQTLWKSLCTYGDHPIIKIAVDAALKGEKP